MRYMVISSNWILAIVKIIYNKNNGGKCRHTEFTKTKITIFFLKFSSFNVLYTKPVEHFSKHSFLSQQFQNEVK